MIRAPLVLAASVLLAIGASGCVEKIAESRVRSALTDAGLSRGDADCMARRMVDRLTIAQLRKLEALKAERGSGRSLGDYMAVVRQVGDAEAVAVTASSAALCAAGLG